MTENRRPLLECPPLGRVSLGFSHQSPGSQEPSQSTSPIPGNYRQVRCRAPMAVTSRPC